MVLTTTLGRDMEHSAEYTLVLTVRRTALREERRTSPQPGADRHVVDARRCSRARGNYAVVTSMERAVLDVRRCLRCPPGETTAAPRSTV